MTKRLHDRAGSLEQPFVADSDGLLSTWSVVFMIVVVISGIRAFVPYDKEGV